MFRPSMNRIRKTAGLFCVGFASFFVFCELGPSEAAEIKDIRKNFGFFIGINGTHLKRTDIAPLHCAINDALAMAWRYVDELGLIPPENCFILLDGKVGANEADHLAWFQENRAHVTPNAVFEDVLHQWEIASKSAKETLGPGSIFIVSLSGHGAEHDEIPFLMVPPGKNDTIDLFPIPKISLALAELPPTSLRILLVDACRTAIGKGAGSVSTNFADALRKASGSVVFSSCRSGERSFEDDDAGYGIFTQCFLDAARGFYDFGDSEIITLASIIPQVSAKVAAAALAAKKEDQ